MQKYFKYILLSALIFTFQMDSLFANNSLYDFVSTGNLVKVQEYFKSLSNEDAKEQIHKIQPIGMNIWHSACQRGDIEMMKFFLQYEVDISQTDERGRSTELFLALSGNVDAWKFLESQYELSGTWEDLREDTLLHHVALEGTNKMGRFLLSTYKQNPNARDVEGKTPLHLCALSIHYNEEWYPEGIETKEFCGIFVNDILDYISALLEYGADKSLLDNQGQTAFDLASHPSLKSALSLSN